MRSSQRFWSKFYIFSKYQRQYIFHSKTGGGGIIMEHVGWYRTEEIWMSWFIFDRPPTQIFQYDSKSLGRPPHPTHKKKNLLDSDKICITSAQNSMTSYFRYTPPPPFFFFWGGGGISLYIPAISPLSDHGAWRMDNHPSHLTLLPYTTTCSLREEHAPLHIHGIPNPPTPPHVWHPQPTHSPTHHTLEHERWTNTPGIHSIPPYHILQPVEKSSKNPIYYGDNFHKILLFCPVFFFN